MEPKNTRYTQARKEYGKTLPSGKLSREKAAELLRMSPEKLEKIENGKLRNIPPIDIKEMAKQYKDESLCSYYCANDCEIGKHCEVKEVIHRDIHEIAISTLASINKLNREHNNFINIVEDGQITDDEMEKFQEIKEILDNMQETIASLQLWYKENIK